jgi:peptide/nickel transport system permease protein
MRVLLRTLLSSTVVLIGVSMLVFCLARVIPGDPARIALGPDATQEQIDNLRRQLNLDEPLVKQYVLFAENALQGDFGRSLYTNRPVSEDLKRFLPVTLELIFLAAIFTLVVGVPCGILMARARDGLGDNAGRLLAMLGASAPSFVWAIFLMLLFAYSLNWLPIAGRFSYGIKPPQEITGFTLIDSLISGNFATFRDGLRHMILPAAALAITGTAQVARMTRTSMVQILDTPYMDLARAYNFPDRAIAFKYALRPAISPALTVYGMQVAAMLANAFLVESAFGFSGIAAYGVNAVLTKDLNAIVGVVMVIAVAFLIANLAIDAIIVVIDPRVRRGRPT